MLPFIKPAASVPLWPVSQFASVRPSAPSGPPDYEFPGTNLFTFPQQFDDAAWVKTGLTPTANAALGPDGTMTADNLVKFVSSGAGSVHQDVALTPGNYIVGIIAKANAYTKMAFREANITGAYSAYNLTGAGVLLDQGSGSSSATISALAEASYYKMEIPVTLPGSTTYRFSFHSLDPAYTTGSVTGNWAGDGVNGLLFWLAHLRTA